ncbi:MAG: hypothetical protein AAGK78_02720, partial [Planctomycetota bacterium]
QPPTLDYAEVKTRLVVQYDAQRTAIILQRPRPAWYGVFALVAFPLLLAFGVVDVVAKVQAGVWQSAVGQSVCYAILIASAGSVAWKAVQAIRGKPLVVHVSRGPEAHVELLLGAWRRVWPIAAVQSAYADRDFFLRRKHDARLAFRLDKRVLRDQRIGMTSNRPLAGGPVSFSAPVVMNGDLVESAAKVINETIREVRLRVE